MVLCRTLRTIWSFVQILRRPGLARFKLNFAMTLFGTYCEMSLTGSVCLFTCRSTSGPLATVTKRVNWSFTLHGAQRWTKDDTCRRTRTSTNSSRSSLFLTMNFANKFSRHTPRREEQSCRPELASTSWSPCGSEFRSKKSRGSWFTSKKWINIINQGIWRSIMNRPKTTILSTY